MLSVHLSRTQFCARVVFYYFKFLLTRKENVWSIKVVLGALSGCSFEAGVAGDGVAGLHEPIREYLRSEVRYPDQEASSGLVYRVIVWGDCSGESRVRNPGSHHFMGAWELIVDKTITIKQWVLGKDKKPHHSYFGVRATNASSGKPRN